jgi:Zn finger protein HypA/HybF involved in hydrogenase expression
LSTSIDSNSRAIWNSKNQSEVQQNSVTAELASMIDERLKIRKGYAPITLDFPSIKCPNCREGMSTIPFGEQPMKCPACKQYAGEIQGTDELIIYA